MNISANQNDPISLVFFGMLYYNGKYVEKNINIAIHYFKRTSSKNEIIAIPYLADIFYLKKNFTKSSYYLSYAINYFNNPLSQHNLVYIYLEGKIVSQAINKEIESFLLSANPNYVSAQHNLGILYLNGKYTEKNRDKTVYYLELASSEKNIDKTICCSKKYFFNRNFHFCNRKCWSIYGQIYVTKVD